MRRLLCASAFASLLPYPAFAEPALVDQVERLDVQGGATELEWQTAYGSATDHEESTLHHIFSGEHAFTDRISLGFEIGAETPNNQAFSADYLFLQAKVVALDPDDEAIGLGLQASFGPSLEGGEGEAELEILSETRVGAIILAADIAIEAELNAIDVITTRYALRADWRRGWGVIGLEAGGDLNPALDEAPRHWFGPLVAFAPTETLLIELSYLRGLNKHTPGDQFRLQIGRAF